VTAVTAAADPSALFDDELMPVLRRLSERPAAAAGPPPAEVAEARSAVWQGLAELGALRPAGVRESLRTVELAGAALLQSPYLDTLLAAELIAATGLGDAAGLLDRIAAGGLAVPVAVLAGGRDDPRRPEPLRRDGDRVTGRRRFVGFAADAELILVVTGPELLLVGPGRPGVAVRRQDDLGRGELYELTLTCAEVPAAAPAAAWAPALDRARLRLAAYLCGMCLGAIDLSTGHARTRSVFGQPLARLQAPAFRLAALAGRTEAVRSLVARGAEAADAGGDAAVPAAQALLLAGELAVETAAEAIQLHGAYGLTEECDAQLFYRRATVDRLLLGGPDRLVAELATAARHSAARQSAGR
jgi:alkylation response protein AidB-like acyl-CoA dehydrogenase